MVTGLGSNAPVGIDPAALVTALKQALVATKKVTLFESENIADAVAEHDRTLNPLFSRRGALRYGRWAAADALLLCCVEELPSSRIRLRLSLRDPLTASVVAESSETTSVRELDATMDSLAGQLMTDWVAGRVMNAGDTGPRVPSHDSTSNGLSQPPAAGTTRSPESKRGGGTAGEKPGEPTQSEANQPPSAARKTVVILPPDVTGNGNMMNPLPIDAWRFTAVLQKALASEVNVNLKDTESFWTNNAAAAVSALARENCFGAAAQATALNMWRRRGTKGVDAFLWCDLVREQDETVGVRLSLRVAETMGVIVSRGDMATVDNAESKIKSLAKRLIDDWLQNRTGSQDDSETKESGTGMAPAELSGLPDALHSLVLALRGVRSSPDSSNAHRVLADAYAGLDRRRQFAIEVEKALDVLDVGAPDAPHTLGTMCEWLGGITGSRRFVDPEGAGVSANTRRPRLNPALQNIDPKKFQRPAALLFATFPDDLDAMSFRKRRYGFRKHRL